MACFRRPNAGEGSRGFGGLGLTVWIGVGVVLGLTLLVLGLVRLESRRAGFGGGRVPRVAADEVRRRLDVGAGLTLVDARRSAKFVESPIQAAGAIRYDVERSSPQALQVQVTPNGDVIAYCDCPEEATSAQVALQLLKAGYRNVSVVRGGFQESDRGGRGDGAEGGFAPVAAAEGWLSTSARRR